MTDGVFNIQTLDKNGTIKDFTEVNSTSAKRAENGNIFDIPDKNVDEKDFKNSLTGEYGLSDEAADAIYSLLNTLDIDNIKESDLEIAFSSLDESQVQDNSRESFSFFVNKDEFVTSLIENYDIGEDCANAIYNILSAENLEGFDEKELELAYDALEIGR